MADTHVTGPLVVDSVEVAAGPGPGVHLSGPLTVGGVLIQAGPAGAEGTHYSGPVQVKQANGSYVEVS